MKNDELCVHLISSSGLRGRLDEIVILFRHRFVIFLLFAPTLLIAAISHRADGLPVWLDAAAYAVGALCFLACLTLFAILLRRVIRWPETLHVPFLMLNLPAAMAAIACAEVLSVAAGAAPRAPLDLAAAAVLIVVLIEASMTLAARSVLRSALDERRETGGELAAPPDRPAPVAREGMSLDDLPQSLRIGGRDIPLSDLSHIAGDGNMVMVRFGSLSLRLAARFATVMVAIPEEAGMQINRMIWVSAPQAARSRLVRSGRDTALQLPDGTELPVAPNRRAELAAWMRALQGGG